jgi:predicted nucleic acid-binding protein
MSQNHDPRPTVFLDTSVLMHYLRGGSPESRLLSDRMLKRFRFAVNPVVLSEVLLAADASRNAAKLEQIREAVQILPINDAELTLLSDRLRRVRNRAIHTNDFLIYSSAVECDYLLTEDKDFKTLATGDRPAILTTSEFLERAEHS